MRLRFLAAFLLLLPACVSSAPAPAPAHSTSLFDLITPGAPRWKALPDAPLARQNAASAQLGDRIFVIGGLTKAGATNRVDTFDVVSKKWLAAPAFPIALHHACATLFDSTLWVVGGADERNRPLGSTYRLIKDQWVAGPALRHPRFAFASAAIGDSLFAFGGQGASGALIPATEVLKAGASDWKIVKPIPTPRYALAVAVIGSSAYLSGGRTASKNLAAFESYDASSDAWTTLANIPDPRSDHASVAYRGKVVLLGGEPVDSSGQPPISVTDEFDPVRSAWIQTLSAMFQAKHGFAAASSTTAIYVLGGGSLSGVFPTVSCEELVTS